jgi:hypothetical protein
MGKIHFLASLVIGLRCEAIFMSGHSSGHEYWQMLKKANDHCFVGTNTMPAIAYGKV